MARRGNNEGSIYKTTRGTWAAAATIGRDATGKAIRQTVYGKTRAEVAAKLGQVIQDSTSIQNASTGKQLFGVYIRTWLERKRSKLRPRTFERYLSLIHQHLGPLEKVRVNAVRPEQIQALYDAKEREGLAPRTVLKLHMLISGSLAQAVKWRALVWNPAAVTERPRPDDIEIRPPSPEEVTRLLSTARAADDRLYTLWYLAFLTGARQGELLGLQWSKVNLDDATVAIERTLVSVRGGVPLFGSPKTTRSMRTISLPSVAVAELKRWHAVQAAEQLKAGADYDKKSALVFADEYGQALPPRNVARRWKAALELAGLPSTVRFHDARHYSATAMLTAGVSPRMAADRLGHADVRITLSTYSHVTAVVERDAAELVAASLVAVN